MREIRGVQDLVIDAVCDRLELNEGKPSHEKTIRRFVALVLPHARRAAEAATPDERYSQGFAKAKRKGEKALAREPSAKAAFQLFCGRVTGTMGRDRAEEHEGEEDSADEEVG